MVTGKIENGRAEADRPYWLSITTDSDVVATVCLGSIPKHKIEIMVKTYCVEIHVPDAIYSVDTLEVKDSTGRTLRVYNPIPRNEV